MRRVWPIFLIFYATGALPSGAWADVRLPRIFADNMVLQREAPIRVWGWASPGEAVKVTLAGKEAAAGADAKGQWSVELPAMKDGEGLELTVTGKNTITLKNLIVGDVWICSGQSNMEWPMSRCLGAADDAKDANLPRIRRIKITPTTSACPEDDVPVTTPWQVCAPQNAGSFTAVGFYFAREINKRTGIPIGIVDDNLGATSIEPWASPEGLELVPKFKGVYESRQKAIAKYQTEMPKALDAMERWVAETKAALSKGERFAPGPLPKLPANPAADGWGTMYNAMIHPLLRFPIKGAVWYQGESNCIGGWGNGGDGDLYCDKMCALVGGWRKQWAQGDFPFYFVQLANWDNAAAINDKPVGGDPWARLRAAQTKALIITNTGMAVTSDIGDNGNLHPRNKYDVGERLARWALARDYGQKDVVVSGPLFREIKIEGDKARLFFDYAASGLMVGQKEGRAPTVEVKDGKLRRFAIAGANKSWQWAEAVIDGETVLVSSPNVKDPVAVRYSFSANPEGANLYNREGLPASSFRTDKW